MPPVDLPVGIPFTPAISDDDIARRAFELYCDRGRLDGYDVDDWLTAEQQLRGAANSSAA